MSAQRPLPKQIRAARALLGWTQKDLAEAAGLRLTVVGHVEAGEHVRGATLDALRTVLQESGIQFLGGNAPGVRHNHSG